MKNRKNPESKIKNRKPKAVWLLVGLFIAVLLVFLLLYKPPYQLSPSQSAQGEQVTAYLTHELLPQLYNGVQRQVPFNLVITQQGINDIVAFSRWQDAAFPTPAVFFTPDRILLISQVIVGRAKFAVTIELKPVLNKQRLLNLNLEKVRIGAVNVTPIGRLIIWQIYSKAASARIDPNDIRGKLVSSLLNRQFFDPVIAIDDKKARIEKIIITREKLTLRLVPIFD